jgi:hypothetical protein
VFHGGPGGIASGTSASAATRLASDQTLSWFGTSVAGAGDVDGDGYDDVIVGASHYDDWESGSGAAFVFRGGPAGVAHGGPADAAARLGAAFDGAAFGSSVAGAGDVNGDGYDDVIAGAPGYDPVHGGGVGATFVFLGGLPVCRNGLDDDGDGRIDHPLDKGCTSEDDPSERVPTRACDDGRDNDGDGLADAPQDPGCRDPLWLLEDPECQDGLDNDGQPGIDFDGGASVNGGTPLDGADPHCTQPWKKERPGCGLLGAELGLVMLLRRWLRPVKRAGLRGSELAAS